MNESRVRRKWTGALFLVVSLVFVALLLQRQWTSLADVAAGIREFQWSLEPVRLTLSISFAIADLLLMGTVWVRLFRCTGGAVPWWIGVRLWVITNFGRYIPGKVWQLGGLAAFMKERGDSGAAALISAVLFQIVSLVTGIAVALATIGSRWITGGASWIMTGLLLFAILALGLHPGVIRAASRRLAWAMGEAEVNVELGVRDIGEAAVGMLVAWCLYGVGFAFLLSGLGVASEALDLRLVTGVFAASYVVGYAALVAPGGLIVREGAMAGLLAELARLSMGVAAAVAVAARIWMVAAELGALLVVLMLGRGPESREVSN